MNYTQLKYFCTIVEYMSFTRAAEHLYISQSALSKSIAQLEGELHCELFTGRGKNMALTRHGQILLEQARELIAYTDRKTEEIYTRLGLSNEKLSIGIPPTAGAIFFHRVVKSFARAYPDTQITIEEGASKTVLRKILDLSEDIGIVIEPCINDNLEKFSVVESETVAIVSRHHPLAGRGEISMSELKNENFVLISSDFMFHDLVLQKCYEAGFNPRVSFTSPHWEWLYSMVREDEGITILPYPLVAPYINDEVRVLRLKEPEFPWILSVIWNKNSILSSSMSLFLEICREESQKMEQEHLFQI